jgi:hypothetical protein
MISSAQPRSVQHHAALPTAVHARRAFVLLFPALASGAVAAAVVGYMGTWLQLEPRPLLPHLTVGFGILVLQYAISALLFQVEARDSIRRGLVWIVNLPITLAAVTYYVVLVFCLVFMRDIPTRQLIGGYLREMPALAAALPVTGAALSIVLAVVVAALAGFAAAVAACLAAGSDHINAFTSTRARRIGGRMLAYGSLAYLALCFTGPFDWQIESHEPLTAG